MAVNFNPDDNPFKDASGRWRTTSLFWEWRVDGYTPLWSNGSEHITRNGVKYQSLQLIYMDYDHVPGQEYTFAIDQLTSWAHWLRLQESPRCMELITAWRDELEVKNQAKQFKVLMAAAREGDTSAAKFLVDKLSTKKRGRPSNDERQAALKEAAREDKDFLDDMKRIGLKVVS